MIMKTIKHKIQYCLLCIIACCGMNSCNFLDVDPELGLSDEEFSRHIRISAATSIGCMNPMEARIWSVCL